MALRPAAPTDPVVEPAFQLLQKQPLSPARAVPKVSKDVQDNVALHLERLGQISRVRRAVVSGSPGSTPGR